MALQPLSLQQLCDVLQATSSADKETRKRAEDTLLQYQYVSGHLSSLMQCVVAVQLDISLRQAASIQFKNLVVRCWDPEEGEEPGARPAARLAEGDKAVVRANTLEALVQAPDRIRAQLGVALRTQLDADFPAAWPDLLPKVCGALRSTEPPTLYGGLFALRHICRKYEYKDAAERAVLYGVVREAFPQLLSVLQSLLALPGCSPEVAELLKLCLKTFWSSIYLDIPPLLQDAPVFHAWMAAVGQLIERPLPAEAQPAGAEERAAWGWWKAKKWAFRSANRLFTRYSKPSSCRDAGLKAFASRFRTHYAGGVVDAYLRVLSTLTQPGGYLPDRLTTYALQLLEAAVPKPGPYKLLAPQLPALLFSVVFPLLCFAPADAALWEEDPHEYVRKGYDIIEDMYSPRSAALSFVTTLLRTRPADQLHPFLARVAGVLQARAAPGGRDGGGGAAQLDGALYALGGLVDVLKRRPPYSDQLEGMLVAHVLPEFGAAQGHIRAKACWVAGKYADIPFEHAASFNVLMSGVVACLCDAELPVRVDAVVALRSFVDAADDVAPLRAVLPQLLDQLFRLMAEVENNDDLVYTLEAVVEKFGDEMVPYAVGIIQNLVAGFWRVLQASDAAGDDDDGSGGALECMGALRAMATVLDAVSDVPSLFAQLEPVLLPVLTRMLTSDGQDVYEETLQILNYVSYFAPVPMSDGVWALFPVLLHNLSTWGLEYFDDSLAALDNLISREPGRFLTGADARGVRHVDAVFSLCARVLGDESVEDGDAVCAPQLIAVVLQHCRGGVDALLDSALRLVAARLEGVRPATDAFLRDTLLLVWAHALVYDARQAVAVAARAGVLAPLFRCLTTALAARRKTGKRSHFRREQDKKAVAVALGHLLLLPPGGAPPEVEAARGAVLCAALQLLSDLKVQRDARLKAEAEEEQGEEEEEEDSDDGDPAQQLEEEEEEERQAAAASAPGWGEVPRRGAGVGPGAGVRAAGGDDDDDDDDDWSDFTAEEDGAAGPLDDIDPWVFLWDALQQSAAADPARSDALHRQLDFSAQAALHALGGYAQTRRNELATEKAATDAGAHTTTPKLN